MFTIVLAVSTSKTNWRGSCECGTSVTIVRMSCDNVAIAQTKVYIYIYIYIYILYLYINIYIYYI